MKSFFDQRYYRTNKFFMSALGIWPEQTLFMRCLLPPIYMFILISIMIPEFIRIHDMWGHTNIIIETMVPLFVIGGVTSKLWNGSLNVQTMRAILGRIENHWAQMDKSPNIDILHKHGNRSYIISMAYAAYVYVCTATFVTLPVLPVILDYIVPLNESRPKDVLYQTEYRVDHDKYFYEILFHAYITSFVAMTFVVAVDSTFFTIVEHACGLFEMVGANMNKIHLSIDRSDNDDYRKICYCINLHQEALRFAALVESNSSTAFTMIIGFSLLAMSVSGVQVVLNMHNVKNVLRFGSFVVGQISHVFVNSVYGQRLFDYSLAVHDSVYDSDWIGFSIRNKKLLMGLLMRSQKPSLLTAGKIYIMSMASFSSVMQTAGSYFTVLMSML